MTLLKTNFLETMTLKRPKRNKIKNKYYSKALKINSLNIETVKIACLKNKMLNNNKFNNK